MAECQLHRKMRILTTARKDSSFNYGSFNRFNDYRSCSDQEGPGLRSDPPCLNKAGSSKYVVIILNKQKDRAPTRSFFVKLETKISHLINIPTLNKVGAFPICCHYD